MSRDKINAVFTLLSKREEHRRALAHQSLKASTSTLSLEAQFYSVRKCAKRRDANRYMDILAYDRTSIEHDGQGCNANVVCDSAGRWWVAAQAPLPHNFHAFFYNIYHRSASQHPSLPRTPDPSRHQHRTAILVQLTGWEERGIRKADPYLPPERDAIGLTFTSTKSVPDVQLRHVATQQLAASGTTLSELRVSLDHADDTDMVLWHYHFQDWRDHGVPSGKAVEELKELVMEVHRRREEAGGLDCCEVWVHCSAGVGRTGTFIALSSLLLPAHQPAPPRTHLPDYLELNDLPLGLKHDKVAVTVDELREWRTMLVQTPDQLGLIYQITHVAVPT